MRWPWTARREARAALKEERQRHEVKRNRRLDEAHAKLLAEFLRSVEPGEELILNIENARYVRRLAVLAARSLDDALEPLAREAAEALRTLEGDSGLWSLGDPISTAAGLMGQSPKPTPDQQEIVDRLADIKDSLGQAGGWQLQMLVSKRARNIGNYHGVNGTMFAPNFWDAIQARQLKIDDPWLDDEAVRHWNTDVLSGKVPSNVDIVGLPPYPH
ncbi:hypothetical protein ACIBCN_21710 [Nocardia sp. NPDC051052]|uniref:hypothetical protein n=1 Tax=Nocardia sp. NPDC051052 TaxID=3364322 RepID=UPI0037B48C84